VPHAAIFDVNETMLDLGGLDPVFMDMFGDTHARREWFARLLHLSAVTTVLAGDSDFGSLGGAALEALGVSRGVEIGQAERRALSSAMGRLRAYPDVAPALDALRDDGWHPYALTNTPSTGAEEQLTAAGLIDRFEGILSVEAVGRFKPDPEPYLHAAEVIGSDPAELWMVACHDWDLAGAAAVGMRTAYVERLGMTFSSIYPQPGVRADDMSRLIDLILATRV